MTECDKDDATLVLAEDLSKVIAGSDLSKDEHPQALKKLEPERSCLLFGESVVGPEGGRPVHKEMSVAI